MKRRSLVLNPFVSEAQRRACYAKHDPNWDCEEWEKKIVHNVRRLDPTRTIGLRQALVAEIKRRFAKLKGRIVKHIGDGDAFGLALNQVYSADQVHKAAAETVQPTDAQREAGNYRKGHVRVQGLDVTIETPRGLRRKLWHQKALSNHYGYIRRTEGVDGDHVDVFLGPDLASDRVFIVDQYNDDGFDEHKCMVGFDTVVEAECAYRANYGDDWKGFGAITELSIDAFKRWMHRPNGPLSEDWDFRNAETDRRMDDAVWNRLITNTVWQFRQDPEKIEAFEGWLRTQYHDVGLDDTKLWQRFIADGFKRGAGRSFDDVKKRRWGSGEGEFYKGSKESFLRDSFGHPETVEKVRLLVGRAYSDMEGVTDALETVMHRTLADGLVTGKNPRAIAKDLVDDIDWALPRASTLARTEIIRAHAEGQLDSLEALGVTEVGVEVEWSTTGDGKVCEKCQPLEGVVLSIEDAHGMLPRHPNCRCAWIPAGVGEDQSGQKRGEEAQEAIEESEAEGGDWVGNFSTLLNAFCPGSNTDPTCHPPSRSSDELKKRGASDAELKEFKGLEKRRGELNKKIDSGSATDDEKSEAERVRSRLAEMRAKTVEVKVVETASKTGMMVKLSKMTPYEAHQWLKGIERDDGSLPEHGMDREERRKEVEVDGVRFQYTEKNRLNATTSIYTLSQRNVPEKLWKATSQVVFTDQKNSSDGYWAQMYSMPGFVSTATGGDGKVVVYNGAPIGISTFLHESGHNLAVKTWGRTDPKVGSEYRIAQHAEKPVTWYGEKSPSEDFAEACKMYVEFPNKMKVEYPLKYKALQGMLT